MTSIVDTCHVYMDLIQLADSPDDTGRLAVETPFTISWGVKHPWDESTPAVLSINLTDLSGRYSRSPGDLIGHRLTIKPEYQDGESPVVSSIFDGYITRASNTVDRDGNASRISVSASDRLYVLRTDTRQGPNTDAGTSNGWQWWITGSSTEEQYEQWMKYDGIAHFSQPYFKYPLPYDAADKVSIIDVFDSTKTARDTTPFLDLTIIRYVRTRQTDPARVPAYTWQRMIWDWEIILTGPSIIDDDGYDIDADDFTYPDPGRVRVIGDQLASTDQLYTVLELKYAHRYDSTENGRKYTFQRDGSRSVRIGSQAREGDTVLNLDINWTEYANNADSIVSNIDTSQAIKALTESNNRTRLPTIRFESARNKNWNYYYPDPLGFILPGTKWDDTVPSVIGAWGMIGGTITYDPTNPYGAWTQETTLWPIPTMTDGQPTCADLTAMDSDATFADATWRLGALRYVSKIEGDNQ